MSASDTEYDPVIHDIAAYVYRGPPAPAIAYQRARLALLDSIGCMVETLQLSADARALVGPVVPGTVVPHGVRVPGTAFIEDPVKAAFDIATLIRYLDHNDAYAGAEWGHPSDNLGAILAVGDWLGQQQQKSPMTLHKVLTAQIKAYEIQGVLQQHNAFNAHGLDHVLLVKVASTAVVAWLLGLPEEAALAAVSHAWIDGHPLRIYRQAPNAGPRKGWAAGDACMRAVHLALITQAGYTSAGSSGGAAVGVRTALSAPRWGFSDALYGGKAVDRVFPYGSRVMETALFKLITAEGHGISAVEAAAQVAAQLQARGLVAERDIRAIRIRTQRPAMIIIDKTGPLRNSADRDHSIQYMVAVTLLKQAPVDAADYLDAAPWASDPRVERLRGQMTVVEDPGFTADYADPAVRSVANALLVELTDGTCLDEVVVEFPVGHHKRGLAVTADGVLAKFQRNMGGAFAADEVARILQAVEDDETTHVSELMALLVRRDTRPTTAHL
ncbi:hypothetical protein SCUCBS95973_002832 [Sporothrix curviconia]|uniref:2-methylcitrate dehydratase n=1 Tax=Sporothrix curviconia TaxID=1260050 RepID=A0ABP0BAD6_9PEZI